MTSHTKQTLLNYNFDREYGRISVVQAVAQRIPYSQTYPRKPVFFNVNAVCDIHSISILIVGTKTFITFDWVNRFQFFFCKLTKKCSDLKLTR
jgi:hypothetical protein